ncbi:hypothetical protein V2G26_008903 [Clonostachys chloroleuca]
MLRSTQLQQFPIIHAHSELSHYGLVKLPVLRATDPRWFLGNPFLGSYLIQTSLGGFPPGYSTPHEYPGHTNENLQSLLRSLPTWPSTFESAIGTLMCLDNNAVP